MQIQCKRYANLDGGLALNYFKRKKTIKEWLTDAVTKREFGRTKYDGKKIAKTAVTVVVSTGTTVAGKVLEAEEKTGREKVKSLFSRGKNKKA